MNKNLEQRVLRRGVHRSSHTLACRENLRTEGPIHLALLIEVVPTIVLPALPFSSAPSTPWSAIPQHQQEKEEETGADEEK